MQSCASMLSGFTMFLTVLKVLGYVTFFASGIFETLVFKAKVQF